MDYLDFELDIGPAIGEDYPIAVLRSPAGEAHELARPPALGVELSRSLRSGRDVGTSSDGAASLQRTARGYGTDLFEAFFKGTVRTRFESTLHEARSDQKGIRIKLRIRAPELAGLPWEVLYDPQQGQYLALSRTTVLSRYIALPHPTKKLKVSPPLRVLGVISTPRNTAAMNVADERRRVEAATAELRRDGRLELVWLANEEAQIEHLQTRLQDARPWHVLHFIGHGGYDTSAPQGRVAFTDDAGNARWIGGDQLGLLLGDHPSLRLVVLNCCRSAQSSEISVFASTAAQVAHSGVPAVVAMQRVISDDAAIAFADQFYRALAAGLPVEGAVSEGRKAMALRAADNEDLEWSLPVLHMRSPDGHLFDLEALKQAGPVHGAGRQTVPAAPAVFIIYSSRDKADAIHACEILERNGVPCWIAPRNIAPGAVKAEAILQGMEASHSVLLLLSKASNESDRVAREVEHAVRNKKRVVTVRIEEVQLSRTLEYFIGTMQWVDAITAPRNRQLEQIAAELRETPVSHRPADPGPVGPDSASASLPGDGVVQPPGAGATIAKWTSIPSVRVTSAALSRDAEWVIAGTERGEVMLLDRCGVMKWSDAMQHRVSCTAVSGDGQTFFVGTWAGALSAYVHAGFEWRLELAGAVSAIATDRATELIFAGTWAGHLLIFRHDGSIATGPLDLGEAIVRIAVAPDGSHAVAALADHSLVAIDRHGEVRWNYRTAAPLVHLRCWSHETLVVDAEGVLAWLAEDGSEASRVATQRGIAMVASTNDGGALVTIDGSRKLSVYERMKERPRWSISLPAAPDALSVSGATDSLVCAVALQTSGLLAINRFKQTKELQLPVRVREIELSASGGWATCLSQDGQLCLLQLGALKEWLAPAKITLKVRAGSFVEGQVAALTLYLANEGDRDARDIRIRIQSDFLRKALEDTIPALEPNHPREVKRAIEPTRVGEIPLTVSIAYLDELGTKHADTQELFIRVISNRETNELGAKHE